MVRAQEIDEDTDADVGHTDVCPKQQLRGEHPEGFAWSFARTSPTHHEPSSLRTMLGSSAVVCCAFSRQGRHGLKIVQWNCVVVQPKLSARRGIMSMAASGHKAAKRSGECAASASFKLAQVILAIMDTDRVGPAACSAGLHRPRHVASSVVMQSAGTIGISYDQFVPPHQFTAAS